ncbi:hypothetical protein NQ314_013498 [Rhamnusium bicolor]|uniref:Uncharacterized protein n=1 Tax=Rhamnusium bicolor TaxID=1586634 RepID=A0AAV8X6A3_9CUCU|nr:hypothetical protein NQ314_013498 [Rhamnusium bicolor]
MKFFIVLLAVTSMVFANELSDCKCHVGYEAKKEESGAVKCYGIYIKAILPCNLPRRPRCVCSSTVTGIIHDDTGTWCGEFSKGREIRRWACENKEDWKEYSQNHLK